MATNQMEEGFLLKQRDRAIKAIIDCFPNNSFCVEGREATLYVAASNSKFGTLIFTSRTFGDDWDDLMQYLEARSKHSGPDAENGYYWIDKKYRRDWTLNRKV